MRERSAGCNTVADQALDLSEIGCGLPGTPRQQHLTIQPQLEDAVTTRDQSHLTEIALKACQKLLGQPRRSQQEAALPAVFDLDPWILHGVRLREKISVQPVYTRTGQEGRFMLRRFVIAIVALAALGSIAHAALAKGNGRVVPAIAGSSARESATIMDVGAYYYSTPGVCNSPYGGFYSECVYSQDHHSVRPGYSHGGYYPYQSPPAYYGRSYDQGYMRGFERGYRHGQRNPPNTNRRNKFR